MTMTRFPTSPTTVGRLAVTAVAVLAISFLALNGPVSGSLPNSQPLAVAVGTAEEAPELHTVLSTIISPPQEYRGALLPDEQPSDWIPQYPTVALVTFEKADTPRWQTIGFARIIYTPWQVKIEEYIKGEGADERTVVTWGGTIGDTRMEIAEGFEVAAGQRAVVFLTQTGRGMPGPTVDNPYIFDGDLASSAPDDRTLPIEDLLTQLREAAAVEAAAPTE